MQKQEKTGGVLSHDEILGVIKKGYLKIRPFNPKLVKSASVEIRLFNQFRIFDTHNLEAIDTRNLPEKFTRLVKIKKDEPFIIHPGEFALGATLEIITLSNDLLVQIHGKSSWGRLGLLIHSTAGYVDPGWHGRLTLEFSNISPLPIKLYSGMLIGQLNIFELKTPTSLPYGAPGAESHYQGAVGPQESRHGRRVAKK